MNKHWTKLMHAMSISLHALPDVAFHAFIVIVFFSILLCHVILLLKQELKLLLL